MYGRWSESWGRGGTLELLAAGEIDGIIAGSDLIARGALDSIRDRGYSVPADVAVLGFDNWDVLSEESRPPLTSIDMNLQDLGRRAARALVDAIDGRPDPGHHLGDVRLVPRESTATF
jgi:LacI family transcriptional regulator